MIGKFLSKAIKTVSLPLDAVNAAMDILTGGDGEKESRTEVPVSGDLERLRDAIARAAEEIDD